MNRRPSGFSLVEVVLALGVLSFSILAIMGIIPAGLSSSRSSQDETRAAQLAQMVFASLASGAPSNFASVPITAVGGNIAIDLTGSATQTLYGDNAGQLTSTEAGAVYLVTIKTDNSPSEFDPLSANQVTVQVAWPALAPAPSQTKRDFIRIISRF